MNNIITCIRVLPSSSEHWHISQQAMNDNTYIFIIFHAL